LTAAVADAPARPRRRLTLRFRLRATPAQGFVGRFGIRGSLFGQVLTLVLVCLLATQTICLLIVFSLPPPPPVLYRVSEVALALQGVTVASKEGQPPLRVTLSDHPPPVYFLGHSARDAEAELSQRMNVRLDTLVVASEPLRMRLFSGPPPLSAHHRHPVDVVDGIHADHLLMAPFKVALRQGDGRWRVASTRDPFPNEWQRRILLWFVLSAAALAPVAYLFARRLAAPIGVFAAAAERLGRDPGAPPLRLQGPPEVQQAAVAFNDMQQRLRRYVDDRTALVGAVAHDMRTPLTRLRFRIEGAPASLRDKMIADVDQMDAMISSALAFVRDATQPCQRRRLELSSLVESVADEMAETGLDVTADSQGPVVIDGDPVALRRLATNLLENAVKFGARARARVYTEGGDAVIEVDDDGPGIPEADRERVFEPFQRGEPSRSRETGGAGLGLAVVRSVARAHGGEATVVSRADGGLRASARLPLEPGRPTVGP
jgi:two-component system OmpR family sensor kinase